MKDLSHEKFQRLIAEIEDIEKEIGSYEAHDGLDPDVISEEEIEENLQVLKEKLVERRNELKRLSDGCGTH